jgi:ATP-dependent DNA ligase
VTAVATFAGPDLDDVLAGCEQLTMEGVVLKRLDSPYRPGRRSVDWRKVKCPPWRANHAERRIKREAAR